MSQHVNRIKSVLMLFVYRKHPYSAISSKQHTCRLDAIIPLRNTQLKYGIWNILQNSKFTSITLKWNILPKMSFSFRQDFAFTSISNKACIYKWNILQKSRLSFPRGSHAGPSPFLTMSTTPIF